MNPTGSKTVESSAELARKELELVVGKSQIWLKVSCFQRRWVKQRGSVGCPISWVLDRFKGYRPCRRPQRPCVQWISIFKVSKCGAIFSRGFIGQLVSFEFYHIASHAIFWLQADLAVCPAIFHLIRVAARQANSSRILRTQHATYKCFRSCN